MAVTQYIGARYVPVFADPAEWSSTKQYEPLTIVLYQGNSFTSKQFVPVGIDINDTNYWAETGNYNAQVEQYRDEVMRFSDDIVAKSFAFDTVENMTEYNNLYAGAICHTNGFHETSDGGSSWYIISDTGTPNGMDILACENGLFANLVIEKDIRVESFGAKGDGIIDDSAAINRMIEICGYAQLSKKTYVIANTITLKYRQYINGNMGTLAHATSGTFACILIDGVESPARRTFVSIKDLIVIGNTNCSGINTNYAADFTISNCVIDSCKYGMELNNALVFDLNSCEISHCKCALYGSARDFAPVNNVKFTACRLISNELVMSSVAGTTPHFKNVVFDTCEIEGNADASGVGVIRLYGSTAVSSGPAVIFDSCWIENNEKRFLYTELAQQTPIVFNSCVILSVANACDCLIYYTNQTACVILNNCADRSTYTGNNFILTNQVTPSKFIWLENCMEREGEAGVNNYTYGRSNFRWFPYLDSHEITLKQGGSANTGLILAESNQLKIKSNTLSGIFFEGTGWEKPLRIGPSMRVWEHSSHIYAKAGEPASGTDGTQIV